MIDFLETLEMNSIHKILFSQLKENVVDWLFFLLSPSNVLIECL